VTVQFEELLEQSTVMVSVKTRRSTVLVPNQAVPKSISAVLQSAARTFGAVSFLHLHGHYLHCIVEMSDGTSADNQLTVS
jgi:hypothetical protein